MQLLDLLGQRSSTIQAFAVRFGLTRSPASRVARGERPPTFEHIVAAYLDSGGQVGIRDWIELNIDAMKPGPLRDAAVAFLAAPVEAAPKPRKDRSNVKDG